METKEKYRKNRAKGLRGQGPYPNLIVGLAKITHDEPGTRKSRRKATNHLVARARRAEGKKLRDKNLGIKKGA